MKRGYQGRCAAAVVSFNSKCTISSVQKKIVKENHPITSINTQIQKHTELAEIVENKRRKAQKRKNLKPVVRKFKRVAKISTQQNDYGPTTSEPDMTESDLEVAKEEFLKNLQLLTADRAAIERNTILQRDSSEWLEIRKNIITASNFGPICKRKISKDTAPLVKNILYKKNLSHVAAIAHGIENEQQALQKIQMQENVSIEPCGLFIDQEYPFIGATPDGLIGDEMIVEVKCPFSASKIGFKKATEENKIQVLKFSKKTQSITINKKSDWFFQVQGQLRVTGRQKCLLGIWVGENEPVHVEKIVKDDIFWETIMKPKIVHFYMNCLLPEIINPRHLRGMSIRLVTLEKPTENIENKNLTQNIPDFQTRDLTNSLGNNWGKADENFAGPSTRRLTFDEF